MYTKEQLDDYKLGFTRGTSLSRKGVDEETAVQDETNQYIIQGIHDAYFAQLKSVYDSRVALLRKTKDLKVLRRVSDARTEFLYCIFDSDYTINKVNNSQYSVDKDGQHQYTIFKNSKGFWECSCSGYKFRHACKHMELFKQLMGAGSSDRLPQHLARVRALEKSLAVWEDRLQQNPNNKQAQKNVQLRRQALEEAKKKAEEIEALPKPTRHPREEFLGVIPSLDKLFEGLGEYEIVGSWRRGKCFAEGTKVRTLNGWKPIEQISVGEEVFNGYGEITKVTRTFKEEQSEWCKIKVRRDSYITCTPDHRFMVWKSNSPRKQFEWVEAKDLGSSNHWKLLTPLLKLPETESIGEANAFLLGWYLADGNLHLCKPGTYENPRVVYNKYECMYANFAANSIRRREFLQLVCELGLYDFSFHSNRGEDNTLSINIRDKELIEFLLEWGGAHCPDLGLTKKPDNRILSLVDKEKDAFLYGFWLGDGTYGKYNSSLSCRMYNTIEDIISVVDTLLSRKYRCLRFISDKSKENPDWKLCYEVRISGSDAKDFVSTMPDYISDAKYVDERVKIIQKVEKQFKAHSQNIAGLEFFSEKGYRYCLEVEDGESFIAEGFTVHNSTYKDADCLTVMSKENWNKLKDRLANDPNFGPAPGHTHPDFGDEVIRGGYKNGDRVDYLDINRVPNPSEYGAWLLFRTGDARFNIAMRGWLKKFGCGLNERGLIAPDGTVVASETEQDIFDAIGIPFIEPKDREGSSKFYQEVRNLKEPAFLAEYRANYEPSIQMSDSHESKVAKVSKKDFDKLVRLANSYNETHDESFRELLNRLVNDNWTLDGKTIWFYDEDVDEYEGVTREDWNNCISDSIKKDKTIVFHSTASREELATIILNKKFTAGRGGGKMLGGGFYANQHLYQAKKNNYGPNILKAQVYGIERFLILDKDIYEELFGSAPDNFIYKQLEERNLTEGPKGISEAWLNRVISYTKSTAQVAVELWDDYGHLLKKKFYGFEYSGNWDKESIVCWYPEKCIKPLEVSFDNAETWIPVVKAQSYLTNDKKKNLSKSEVVRSEQRVKDLITRYEKYPDDKLIHAIKSQLARIADPAKKSIRLEAFQEALKELRPDIDVTQITDAVTDIPRIKNSTDLYNYAEQLGIDYKKPNGKPKGTEEIKDLIAKYLWEQTNPGKEMPPQISPMLIKDITGEGKDYVDKTFTKDKVYLQNKINGQRFIMSVNPDGSTFMTSRDRSVKTFRYSELDDHVLGLQNLKSPFKHRCIVDGEIICDIAEIDLPSGVHTTSTLQSTVALMHMNSKDSLEFQRKNNFSLRYKVFDILEFDGTNVEKEPYSVRKDLVATWGEAMLAENPGCAIDILPVIEDFDSAWDTFEDYVSKGGEGLIIKYKDAPYEQGKRTKGQWKLKGRMTIDGFVTGSVPASADKSLKDYIGGLKFSTNYKGKEVEIAAVSNLDMATRKAATVYDDNGNPQLNPDFLGRCAELICQNFKKGSFRAGSARISEWRDDKNPEDCELQEEMIRYDE